MLTEVLVSEGVALERLDRHYTLPHNPAPEVVPSNIGLVEVYYHPSRQDSSRNSYRGLKERNVSAVKSQPTDTWFWPNKEQDDNRVVLSTASCWLCNHQEFPSLHDLGHEPQLFQILLEYLLQRRGLECLGMTDLTSFSPQQSWLFQM